MFLKTKLTIHLYTIELQIEFIKRYIPEDARLHLIGHSIGSWIILNILKDESITKRVTKCYLLFPTIEHMATTKNGWFFTTIVRCSTVKYNFFFNSVQQFFQGLFISFLGGTYCIYPRLSLLDSIVSSLHYTSSYD